MKKLILLSFCALFTVAANAGVVKYSANHIVKPAARKTSAAAKKSAKVSVKAVKVIKKAAY